MGEGDSRGNVVHGEEGVGEWGCGGTNACEGGGRKGGGGKKGIAEVGEGGVGGRSVLRSSAGDGGRGTGESFVARLRRGGFLPFC